MLGQGRMNASWWRCRLNSRRELPRTQRPSCLRKKRGSFSWHGSKWARRGVSMPKFPPCVGRCFQNLSTGSPWQMGPDFMQKQPELAPISVIFPSKCNQHRPNFMPMQRNSVPNSPEILTNATHINHDFGQYSMKCNQHRPNSTQMQLNSVQNSSEFHTHSTQMCPEFGQHSIHMQPKPSEFHANIGGETPHKEGACVEVVHT